MMLCEFMESPAVWLLTPSRASPLPQGYAFQCGSGLAREGALKAGSLIPDEIRSSAHAILIM
ncbi:hypothetical protein E4T63_22525 [Pseudomonas fluorescens]|uniref:Uncharacterized protein n=1 Tax=Pseudomonas fluorescens TaxID=294 RepID=A0AAP9CKE0_PSEFL|nr:hypothetical protein E3Z29_25790 [Pseudomonas sp. S150]QBX43213.1 hypothetical protein E4T63_22525 [Pseudomonas fluorescens]